MICAEASCLWFHNMVIQPPPQKNYNAKLSKSKPR